MFKHVVRWFILLLMVLGVAVGGWYKLRPREIEVSAARVSRGTVEKIVANTRSGTLNACRRANLSPSLGGQINVLTVNEGDTVQQGQVLLELWNDNLKAQINLTENEIKAATAKAKGAQLQAGIARREAVRVRRLARDQAISTQEVDRIVTEAEVREAAYEAAITEIDTSRARLQVVTADLERTLLTAPFDGIVAKINGELHEYVTPSPPGIVTPTTIELLDTSCFYVTAPIDEVDAPAVQVGLEARVIMDAFGEKHFPGRVRRIDPYVLALEKQARTVDVEVEFLHREDEEYFLSGYSADVEIIIAAEENVLRIPTQALLEGNRVFVYHSSDRRLEERTVQIGISNWDHTQILEGLQEGEVVVTSTERPGLQDGMRARVSD